MNQPPKDDGVPRLSLARVILQPLVGWSWTIVFTICMSVASIVTLGQLSYWITPNGLRLWGRLMLRIQGVKLVVEGAEHFEYPAARVATFNHTSSLDAMIIPAITPPGATVAIKREVLYIPFVGMAAYLIGFLLVDRGKSEKAKRVLAKAAERMRSSKLTVFIAPEGTRSRDGNLQDFKRGAFHLARASGAAIAPVVICDSNIVHPRGFLLSRQGTIRVRILPPIPTPEMDVSEVGDFADKIQEVYERELAEMRAEGGTVRRK